MKKILVIGGGSFGTCLSNLFIENGHDAYLWEYDEKVRSVIRETNENPIFLPGIKLSEKLNVIDDYATEIEKVKFDAILFATPTQFIRPLLKRLKNHLKYNIIVVNVAKGIEISSKKRISEVIEEELGKELVKYVLLSGPTHAEEVAKKMPSAILSVSEDFEAAKEVQQLFSNSYLRVYTGTDLIGAELGGALKNCLAIAAGMADGFGYGDNSKAALLTRGLNEMVEIGKFYGAEVQTFMGLSGLGDMIVTCTSQHSRNRYVGEQLAKGRTIEDIVSNMKMVSEGAETIKALYEIIKINNIKAPIFSALYEVIYKGKPADELYTVFMTRELKSEF